MPQLGNCFQVHTTGAQRRREYIFVPGNAENNNLQAADGAIAPNLGPDRIVVVAVC